MHMSPPCTGTGGLKKRALCGILKCPLSPNHSISYYWQMIDKHEVYVTFLHNMKDINDSYLRYLDYML